MRGRLNPVRGPIRLKRPTAVTEAPAQAPTRVRLMSTSTREIKEFRRLVR